LVFELDSLSAPCLDLPLPLSSRSLVANRRRHTRKRLPVLAATALYCCSPLHCSLLLTQLSPPLPLLSILTVRWGESRTLEPPLQDRAGSPRGKEGICRSFRIVAGDFAFLLEVGRRALPFSSQLSLFLSLPSHSHSHTHSSHTLTLQPPTSAPFPLSFSFDLPLTPTLPISFSFPRFQQQRCPTLPSPRLLLVRPPLSPLVPNLYKAEKTSQS
jgi:hypothetical protein